MNGINPIELPTINNTDGAGVTRSSSLKYTIATILKNKIVTFINHEIIEKSSTPFNYPILTPNQKRPIISSNLSNEIPLVFETLKTSKNDFYRSEHQKRKDEICPFSILAFL